MPAPEDFHDDTSRAAAEKALKYMDLTPGTPLRDIAIDTVFLGSCTNARIEDLRTAADILRGRRIHSGVRMMVVPSSTMVRNQAEEEGLDRIFTDAGAEWRTAGCSMCLGMNPDHSPPASAPHPPPTATSKAAKDPAGAPTWSPRQSPPPPP